MSAFDLLTALLGALVLGLALPSARLERTPFTPTVLALLYGVLVGPRGLGWMDLAALGDEPHLREQLARLTLGIGLIGVALRIPAEFPRRHWRSLLVLVGPGMLLMWGVSTVLAYAVLGVPFWTAALLGAIVTPTDPIAATPVVTGPLAEAHLPERVRHTISFESGANDGLAYLFVFLPFLMLTLPPGEAAAHWLTRTLLWEVGAAAMLGVALGLGAGKLLRWADATESVQGEWRLIYTVALALLAVGLGRLIGSDEVLVAFVAGAAFVQIVSEEEREEEDVGQEAVNRFFSVPIFAVVGATIPWEGWLRLGWAGALFAAGVLLLRRIPVVLLLRPAIGTLADRREALLVGWFGPIAVSAMYYASMMETRTGSPLVWEVASLTLCASVLAHGLSGAPLTRSFGSGR